MSATEHRTRVGELSEPATRPGGILAGKRLLITGVVTRQSIAFSVAEAAQEQGAEIVLTSFGRMRRLTERAVAGLHEPVRVLELDVNEPDDYERLRAEIAARWRTLDGVLHSVAYAPGDALGGNFLQTPPESAELAFRTSAYSFKALAAAFAPLMTNGGSIVGLDFDASRAWPEYDWMGVSKAALEAVSRYLARYLGPRGIRVNLVSCGPLRTVAASGVAGFDDLAETWQLRAPLGWDTRDTRIAAGPICFLLSDLARGVSGELLHVDGGFNAIGATTGVRH